MRTLTQKKSEGFQYKPTQQKNVTKDQNDLLKKALEEAKRQAYSDMGLCG